MSLIIAYCQNTLYISWIYAISNKWLRQIVTIEKICRSKLLITYIKLLYQYQWRFTGDDVKPTNCPVQAAGSFGFTDKTSDCKGQFIIGCSSPQEIVIQKKCPINLESGKVIIWSNHWTQIKFFLYLFDLGWKQNVKYSLYL